jgi:multiple sugar transport system substrate-binding protein
VGFQFYKKTAIDKHVCLAIMKKHGDKMNLLNCQQRLALAESGRKYSRGMMSRKEFINICLKAGLGFSGLSFLGACGSDKQKDQTKIQKVEDVLSKNSAGVTNSDQQKFLKEWGKLFKGKTLSIVTENTPPSKFTRQLAKKEFEQLTGIHIEWELLPLDKVLSLLLTDTVMKSGRNDIYYWDQAWVGRFVNDAVNPMELMQKKDLAYPGFDFDDFLQPLVENIASYGGNVVGLPYDIPVFILMYRKDIFEELKLNVPTTLDEFMTTAKAITEAKAPQVYGTIGQWKSGHYALECDMTAWLWAHGGSIFGKNNIPAINDERAYAAMEYMMALKKYMPPGVTGWDWSGQIDNMAKGRAGMYISWGEGFPTYDDPRYSKVVGLMEPAPCPKEIALRTKSECSFDETPGMSHQGGSCLAISKYSRNIEAAWIFLQWATSADITTRAGVLGGASSPVRKSNYTDPRVLAKKKVGPGTTRHFDVTLDAILNRMGTEPHLPMWASLSVDSFAVELGKMTTGQQSIKNTLDNMAKDALKASKQ